MKLFAVYIGGEMQGANIELHDMRFVAAPSLEATYAELRRQWWGIPGSLHIDGWCELTRADGYEVTLKQQPSEDENRLFYVNLGGYDPSHFTELHKNTFVVAPSASKAKVRALKTVRDWDAFHMDDMYEAEQAIRLDDSVGPHWHIHLAKIADESPPPFTCRYKPLGR